MKQLVAPALIPNSISANCLNYYFYLVVLYLKLEAHCTWMYLT